MKKQKSYNVFFKTNAQQEKTMQIEAKMHFGDAVHQFAVAEI